MIGSLDKKIWHWRKIQAQETQKEEEWLNKKPNNCYRKLTIEKKSNFDLTEPESESITLNLILILFLDFVINRTIPSLKLLGRDNYFI